MIVAAEHWRSALTMVAMLLTISGCQSGNASIAPDGGQFPGTTLEGTTGTNSFSGQVAAVWLEDGRTMKLLQPFAFVSASGQRWTVPKGAEVDGASIPRMLWAIVGSPFVGKYRNASVVHDYYCDTRVKGWEDVHLMFYLASLASGVGASKAKLMYYAVYRFGPRWTPDGKDLLSNADASEKAANRGHTRKFVTLEQQQKKAEAELKRIERWIEKNNPSIQQLASKAAKI